MQDSTRYGMNRLKAYTLTAIVITGSVSATQERAAMPKERAAILQKYCFECHSADVSEGGVNLEGLSLDMARDIPTAELWQKVLDAMNSKEMPPEDQPQVPAADKTVFLDALSTRMVQARRILSDSGGVITLRRLNRREYANTLESLLGVRPDVSNLPDDQSSSGFDTAGASLFFSSDQLEQYLAVARNTLRVTLAEPHARKSRTVRVEPEAAARELYAGLRDEYRDKVKRAKAWKAQSEKPASEFGFLDQYSATKSLRNSANWLPQLEEYLERPETEHGVTMILTIKKVGMAKVKLPPVHAEAGGDYVLRVRAAAYPNAMPRMHYLELTSRVVGSRSATRLGWRKVTGSLAEPEVIEFPFTHPPGEKMQYFVHQRTHQDRGDKNLWTLHREQNGMGTLPGTWVDWAELEGPLPDKTRGAAAAEVFFPKPLDWDETRYAKEVIKRFASRAFRSETPTDEFLDKLVQQYASRRAKGEGVEEALVTPLSIVLSSPGFLYMVESSGGGSPELMPMEIAVRLSYLLWSEPPDEQLTSLARSGRLANAEVLRGQTDRLLADNRSGRFVEAFTHQWLQMERLEMFEFQGRRYPDFDNATRESARKEIYETIRLMLRDRLPLRTLLKADFVVVNDVLADYYGLKDAVPADGRGHEFRPVQVPTDSPRGGLLGTAAVLAMGSDGLRSSPVERGAWVLRHLLHDPPPPAPANVPQLARLEGQVLGARQLQRVHMEEPQCAQCHRKIDPVGYGLEHFDAAGGWRDMETVFVGKRRNKEKLLPIDSRGVLPTGETFKGYFELRDAIAKHENAFARGFAESLISYGLGRPYGFTDKGLADEILKQASGGAGAPNAFIHALVQSNAFRSKSPTKASK